MNEISSYCRHDDVLLLKNKQKRLHTTTNEEQGSTRNKYSFWKSYMKQVVNNEKKCHKKSSLVFSQKRTCHFFFVVENRYQNQRDQNSNYHMFIFLTNKSFETGRDIFLQTVDSIPEHLSLVS